MAVAVATFSSSASHAIISSQQSLFPLLPASTSIFLCPSQISVRCRLISKHFYIFGSYLLSLGSSFLGAPPGVLAFGSSLIFFPFSLFVIASNDIVINVKMPRSPHPLFLRLFGMGGFDLISWLDLILWHGFDLISCVNSFFFSRYAKEGRFDTFLSLRNC